MANCSSIRRRRIVWSGFVLLCLATSLQWLIPPTMTKVSPLQQQGVMYAAIGFCALAFARLGKSGDGLRAVRWGWIALAGVLFLGVPAILLDIVSGVTSSAIVSLLFTVTPVVVVLAVMNNSSALQEESGLQRLFVPVLAGVGGVLCVLPFAFTGSTLEWGAFAVVLAAAVLAGVAGVWLYRLLQAASMAESIAIIGISNAAVLLCWCGLHGPFIWRLNEIFHGLSVALDVVQIALVLLTLWLVREMDPVQLSARYLVIPLLTISEGVVAMRPPVTVRLILGIALLATGTWWLLAARTAGEERPLSLR
jgi:drug/metabolite transporter (DMT)-like permease